MYSKVFAYQLTRFVDTVYILQVGILVAVDEQESIRHGDKVVMI